MAFRSPLIEQLQQEEQRCIRKLTSRARKLMSFDPSLTFASALAKACAEFPKCYGHYVSAREQLGALRVRPLVVDGLGLSRR
jgi:hypothetical protein